MTERDPSSPGPTRRRALALLAAGAPLAAWGVLAANVPLASSALYCSASTRRSSSGARCLGPAIWVGLLGVAATVAAMFLWDRLTRDR